MKKTQMRGQWLIEQILLVIAQTRQRPPPPYRTGAIRRPEFEIDEIARLRDRLRGAAPDLRASWADIPNEAVERLHLIVPDHHAGRTRAPAWPFPEARLCSVTFCLTKS